MMKTENAVLHYQWSITCVLIFKLAYTSGTRMHQLTLTLFIDATPGVVLIHKYPTTRRDRNYAQLHPKYGHSDGNYGTHMCIYS